MEFSEILKQLSIDSPPVVNRMPAKGEKDRWVKASIDGREYQFALPITFTPYASATACSACCKFCSENLRVKNESLCASTLRPSETYFEGLENALTQLRDVPLSYSISGLEASDDPVWFQELLKVLQQHESDAKVEDKVLYSNASGLVEGELLQSIKAFGLSWIELSRHHHEAQVNQRIMRFSSQNPIASNGALAQVIEQYRNACPIKLICVVQKGGVDDLDGLLAYLSWAKNLGIRQVVFRELAQLDNTYRQNATWRYVNESRISVASLFKQFAYWVASQSTLKAKQLTNGYYFSNVIVECNGLEITFEGSDYRQMHEKHSTDAVYKLVYHANGNLCADWSPARNVIFSTNQQVLHAEQQLASS